MNSPLPPNYRWKRIRGNQNTTWKDIIHRGLTDVEISIMRKKQVTLEHKKGKEGKDPKNVFLLTGDEFLRGEGWSKDVFFPQVSFWAGDNSTWECKDQGLQSSSSTSFPEEMPLPPKFSIIPSLTCSFSCTHMFSGLCKINLTTTMIPCNWPKKTVTFSFIFPLSLPLATC